MKKRTTVMYGIGALFGLSLLIEPGEPNTALAAQAAATTAPAVSHQIEGRLVNMPAEINCTKVGSTPVCSYELKGIGVSDRGELIDRTIVGTKHGMADKPGKLSHNRSYAIWTFGDGSTMLLQSEGSGTVTAEEQRVFAGTQTCVAGTGRFADADCTIDWSVSAQPNGLYAGTYSGTVTPQGQS